MTYWTNIRFLNFKYNDVKMISLNGMLKKGNIIADLSFSIIKLVNLLLNIFIIYFKKIFIYATSI